MRVEPIGTIQSCFKEKFGIPRQAGLVPEARAIIRLKDDRRFREALDGLEAFSHVWILFAFHESVADGWRSKVRPPRLGGAKKVGVFASRSPHRPNPIGMSVVRIVRIDPSAPDGPEIEVAGGDFLDGTPVIDLKPYVPYADHPRGANSGWAEKPMRRLTIRFDTRASRQVTQLERTHPGLRRLIRQILAQDPRPAFQARASGEYAARLLDFDLRWEVSGHVATVRELAPA
ncbi:MAG TPA: tRNA (N6-threonylcarbamoyladenosine(37)-N6)-methyltransferase TrmO [Bdellovibrionota bacterium]|nr:tRNA (N6-threonylcarbamoyladenosine(37)-N6)-methyltransferase TrmO [Bdellovibrionota bacterium]